MGRNTIVQKIGDETVNEGLAAVLAASPSAAGLAITNLGAMSGALGVNDDLAFTKTIVSNGRAVDRMFKAELTLTPASGTFTASPATDSFVAVRGLLTVTTGKTVAAGYLYGVQGKLILDGVTINNGSDHNAAVYAQLSASGATLTSGHIAALMADIQTPPADGSNLDLIYGEQVTGTAIHSAMRFNVNSTYFFDLNSAGTKTWALTAGTGANSAALAGGGIAAKVIAVMVDGVAYFLPLFSSNA